MLIFFFTAPRAKFITTVIFSGLPDPTVTTKRDNSRSSALNHHPQIEFSKGTIYQVYIDKYLLRFSCITQSLQFTQDEKGQERPAGSSWQDV